MDVGHHLVLPYFPCKMHVILSQPATRLQDDTTISSDADYEYLYTYIQVYNMKTNMTSSSSPGGRVHGMLIFITVCSPLGRMAMYPTQNRNL